MEHTKLNPVMYRETWRFDGKTVLVEAWNCDPDDENNDWSTFEAIRLEDATPSELAQLMDAAIDNANYHESAGVHRYLAEVLERQVGYSATLRILREIYLTHGYLAEIN